MTQIHDPLFHLLRLFHQSESNGAIYDDDLQNLGRVFGKNAHTSERRSGPAFLGPAVEFSAVRFNRGVQTGAGQPGASRVVSCGRLLGHLRMA